MRQPASSHHPHKHRILESPAACLIWTLPISLGISRFRLRRQQRRRRQQAAGEHLPAVRTAGPEVVATRVAGVRLPLRRQLSQPHRRRRHRTTTHGAHQREELTPVDPVVLARPGARTQMAGDKPDRAAVKMQCRIVGQHHLNSRKAGATRPEIIRIQVPAQPCRLSHLNQSRQRQPHPEHGVHKAARAAVGGRSHKSPMTAGEHRLVDKAAAAGVSPAAAMPGVTNKRRLLSQNRQRQHHRRHRCRRRRLSLAMLGR